jgi:hypothetical protein
LPTGEKQSEEDKHHVTSSLSLLKALEFQTDNLQSSLKRKAFGMTDESEDRYANGISRITPEKAVPCKLRRLIL